MKNSKVFYIIITYLINLFYCYCCYYYISNNNYCYASARVQQIEREEHILSWLDNNDYEIEEDKRIKLFNFFRVILDKATNRKTSSIIHNLAGNSHYTEINNEEDIDINSNRLSFLDTIPDGTPIKLQIYSDLNTISNLAKVGNTREIINILDNVTMIEIPTREEYISLSRIFPLDRKDTLIRFFRRMDNDITRNTLHHLFEVFEAVNSNDLIEANNSLELIYNNTSNSSIYSLRSSLLNLEDFGAGYRSFDIWLNEMNSLLATLNLENKSRIDVILGYLEEANVSYFKPKTNMLIGSFFYSSRTEDEIDGALLCNGQHINTNRYPYFVKTYLKTKRINTISISEWNRQKQESDNVGLFGYDDGSKYFVVPFIPAGTFMSNPIGSLTVGTTSITPRQGDYVRDQIVNLTGRFDFHGGGQGEAEIWNTTGVFAKTECRRSRWPSASNNRTTMTKGATFDASRVVQTGDRVMPRTVFQNLYVIVSE